MNHSLIKFLSLDLKHSNYVAIAIDTGYMGPLLELHELQVFGSSATRPPHRQQVPFKFCNYIIFQSTYTDLVIIAKYEGKKKKDKVKVVEVKWN